MTRHPSWNKTPAVLRLDLAATLTAIPVREPAFRIIDTLQGYPASRQIEAVAAALVIMSNAIGQDAHDLVARAKRQVPDIEAVESAASALSDYAKGELRA